MKNCMIMGSGRSGTSLAAGCLASAGYYFGDNLLDPTEGNPKGYFESKEVERVNEQLVRKALRPSLLERCLPWSYPAPLPQPAFHKGVRGATSGWLALIPPHRAMKPDVRQRREIARLTSHHPFCFKDPRFCYTLPAWLPYLQDAVFVCVFRNPTATAASIFKEVETEAYLAGLDYRLEHAYGMWTLMYGNILERFSVQGDWLFLHYDQLLTDEGLTRLEQFTGATVDRDFPDRRLKRSRSDAEIPAEMMGIYRELCERAGYWDEGGKP